MASLGEDLLATVNKLQDLVFNTIGNDSLDLPQIVRTSQLAWVVANYSTGCRGFAIVRQVFSSRKHRGS
jgi:hypothetical protein